jgi:hypothetical protein
MGEGHSGIINVISPFLNYYSPISPDSWLNGVDHGIGRGLPHVRAKVSGGWRRGGGASDQDSGDGRICQSAGVQRHWGHDPAVWAVQETYPFHQQAHQGTDKKYRNGGLWSWWHSIRGRGSVLHASVCSTFKLHTHSTHRWGGKSLSWCFVWTRRRAT